MIRINIRKPGMMRDAMYYLHPDVARKHDDIKIAHGVIVGCVSVLMAQGMSFQESIAFLSRYFHEEINPDTVPQPWKEDVLKYFK